jgi:hypothetical protein
MQPSQRVRELVVHSAMSTTKRVVLSIVAIVVLLVLFVVGREVYFVSTAKVNPTIDYAGKLNTLVADANAGLPGTARSFDELTALLRDIHTADEAIAREVFPNVDKPGIEHSAMFMSSSTPEEVAAAKRSLSEHASSGRLATLDALPQLLGVQRKIPSGGPLIHVTLADLPLARHSARLCNSLMRTAIRDGDDAAALKRLDQIRVLGGIYHCQATLIDRLVGTAITSLALGTLREEVSLGNVTPTLAAKMLKRLDATPKRPSHAMTIESEQNSTLDFVQWTHTDDGKGNGRIILSELERLGGPFAGGGAGTSGRGVNTLGMFLPDRRETETAIQDHYANLKRYADLSRPKRVAEVSPDDFVARLPRRQMVLSMMLPAMGRAFGSDDQVQSEWDALRIMLALEVHRDRVGNYPTSLAELAPSELSIIPGDAYASDLAYRYMRRTGTKPADAYLLYSIGADGTDDNGKQSPQGAISAMSGSTAGRGFDFVYNSSPQ